MTSFITGGKPDLKQCQCLPLLGPQSKRPLAAYKQVQQPEMDIKAEKKPHDTIKHVNKVESKLKRRGKKSNNSKTQKEDTSHTWTEVTDEKRLDQILFRNVRNLVRSERLLVKPAQMSRCLSREYQYKTRCKNNFGGLNRRLAVICHISDKTGKSAAIQTPLDSKIQAQLDWHLNAFQRELKLKQKKDDYYWPILGHGPIFSSKPIGPQKRKIQIRKIETPITLKSVLGVRKHGRGRYERFQPQSDGEEKSLEPLLSIIKERALAHREVEHIIKMSPQSLGSSVGTMIPWILALCAIGMHFRGWAYQFYLTNSEYVKAIIENKLNRVDTLLGRAETLERHINDYSVFLSEFAKGNLNKDTQISLLELKTLFHILYFAYYQDYANVAAWLSNFAITRSDFVTSFYKICTIPTAPVMLREEVVHYRFGERDYILTIEQLTNAIRMYDEDDTHGALEHYLENLPVVFEPQGQENTFLMTLFGHIAKSYLPHLTDKDIREANTKFAYVNHCRRDMQDQFDTIKTVLSTLSLLVFGFDPTDANYQLFAHDLIKLIKFVDQHALLSEEMIGSRETMQGILDEHEKACQLQVHPRMAVIPDFIKKVFFTRFKTLEDLAQKCKGYMASTIERDEPLFILFTGEPGTGKSAAMKFMRQAISKIEYKKDYSPEMTYVYNPSAEFWEGYCKQPFLVLDDVWKSTDLKDRRNEATTIINAVNVSPFNLPMAFAGKGSNFFKSDYIQGSTNLANRGYKAMKLELGVTDPEAVMRRMELIVHADQSLNGRNLLDMRYRIDKCPLVTEWHGIPTQGLRVNVATLSRIAIECKRVKSEQYRDFTLDPNDVDDVMAGEDLAFMVENNIPIVEDVSDDDSDLDDFQPQSGKEDSEEYEEQTNMSQQDQNHEETDRKAFMEAGNRRFWESSTLEQTPALAQVFTSMAKSYDTINQENFEEQKRQDELYIKRCEKGGEKFGRTMKKLVDSSTNPAEFIRDLAAVFMCDISEEQAKWTAYGFLTLTVGVGSAALMYHLYGHLYQSTPAMNPESKSVELRSGKSSRSDPQQAVLKLVRIPIQTKGFTIQSTEDNYYQCLTRKLSKCIVKINLKCGSDVDKAIAFHIKDRVFATPAHLVMPYLARGDIVLSYTYNGKTHEFPLGEEVTLVDTLDMMIFKVPIGLDIPPMIYNYLLSGVNDPPIVDGTALKLVTYDTRGDLQIKHLVKQPGRLEIPYDLKDGTMQDNKKGTQSFIVKHPISYFEGTQRGDSGSLVTAEGNQGKVHVVAMHIGRYAEHGIAIPLNKKMFENVFTEFQPQSVGSLGLIIDRVVSPEFAVHPPTWTKIRKSPMYHWHEPPTKFPVRMGKRTLEDGTIFDPFIEAIKGVQQIEKPNTGIPDDCFDYLNKQYPKIKGSTIISYEEALNGDPITGTRSINSGTSPGYPFSLNATGGKTPYVTRNAMDHLEYQEDFLEHVQWCEEELKGEGFPQGIFSDTLKDELRPLIEPGVVKEPRVFSTCPLHLLILFRIYFQPLVNTIQKQANEKPIAVGINPHSHQWTHLEARLSRFPGSIVAGDYSKFDKSIPKFVGEAAFKWMIDWFDDGPVNKKVRQKLAKYILEAQHIARDEVYTTQGSNPSGNPITSIYNSLCNLIMMYTVMTRDLGLTTEQFLLIVYGDDNIVASILQNLTWEHIAIHLWSRYGVKYTHFTKGDAKGIVDSIRSIAFLSRTFRPDMSASRAPLPLATIVESTYWRKAGTPTDVSILSTADSFFLELSHHPKDVFDELSDKYLERAKDRVPHLYDSLCRRKLLYYDYFAQMYLQNNTLPVFVPESSGFQNVTTTENLNFTDRAMNDVSVTQVVPLGNFQDAAPITASQVNSEIIQAPHTKINMETFDLNGALDREYLVGTINWNSSQNTGITLGTYNLWSTLKNQPFLKDKLNNFCYIVSGVRVSIRGAANRNLLGSCMMYYEPMSQGKATIGNIYEASGSPHMLISARSSDAIVMDIPFINPDRALRIRDAADGDMGRVTLKVLMPLYDIMGETSSAQFNVFMQFMEAKLFLPHDMITQSGKEARQKGEAGVISGILDSATTVVGAVERVGLSNKYTRIFRRVAQPVSASLKMFGLSKPTTVNATQIIKANPNFDLNYGKGIDTTVKIAVDPENAISTMTNVGGISDDEMALSYIVGTPMLVKQFNMLSTTPSNLVMACASYDSFAFVDHITSMFQYSYGAYKCKVYIWASMFHSCRLVFYLTDSTTANWMDCYHSVIDIQGDTSYEVSIPYLGKSIAASFSENGDWHLRVKILSWSEPMPAEQIPIGFSVYKAGASDFKFGVPMDTMFIPQSNPRQDFAQEFPPIHPNMTGYNAENVIFGEEINTLRELVHRYAPLEATVDAQLNNWRGGDSRGPYQYRHFFRFWRGTVNHRFLYRKSGVNDSGYIATRLGQCIFGNVIKTEVMPQLEMSVPFYNKRLFESTSAPSENLLLMLSPQAKYHLVALGDDFSFHFLVAPPNGTFTPYLTATSKSKELQDFMITP